jgi:hypothetical protein
MNEKRSKLTRESSLPFLGHFLSPPTPIIALDTFLKFVIGKKGHQLRENRFPSMHGSPPIHVLLESDRFFYVEIAD